MQKENRLSRNDSKYETFHFLVCQKLFLTKMAPNEVTTQVSDSYLVISNISNIGSQI